MGESSQYYTGVIQKKIQLTKSIYYFVIQNGVPQNVVFQPGQYATFIIDEKIRRQYSFASDPHDTQHFELVVDVTPMGPGSKYFLEKTIGDKVEYMRPLGNFALSQSPLKKIFIATGTGIAPFRSMMKQMLNDKCKMVNGDLTSTSASLYWGLRYEDDIYWDTEIRGLAGQLTGFQYFLTLSKPSPQWTGLTGHVTDHVFKNEKNLENCEFYLCGNSAMITDMKKQLSDRNVPNELIKVDLFY